MRRLDPKSADLTAHKARELSSRLRTLIGTSQSRETIAEIENLTERAEVVTSHLPRNDAAFELGRRLARETAPAPQPAAWEGR